jgi:hypothetical protein
MKDTKMSKELLDRFGPGSWEQLNDHDDQFDGGDSEMGLTGDGTLGMRKLGRDISPHFVRTLNAQQEVITSSSPQSYADELMKANPGMDHVRAQQYENYALQKELNLANKHMYDRAESRGYGSTKEYYEEDMESSFTWPIEVGETVDGIITLTAPMNGGAARHDLMLKNYYMGFAKFRAAFVGDASNDWSVTPSDGYLKSHEDTHIAVSFRPRHPGVSSGYLVIETEDFKVTYKVVGSTGEYEF